jgi:hypothetical protein
MTNETVKLVHKLDDIPKKDFRQILPRDNMTNKEKD